MKNQKIVYSFEHGMYVRDHPVPGSRGTLLYIHGLGESGLCFEHLLTHPGLTGWRQLIPDLPGYGRSLRLEEPLTLPGHADHLAAWLRENESVRDAPPVVVIGHSMGGVVSLLFCERHPDLVSAMIDVDGNISRDDGIFSRLAAGRSLEAFMADGFHEMQDMVFSDAQQDMAKRGYYVSMRLADPRTYHLNSRELVEVSTREDVAGRMAALPMRSYYMAAVPNGISQRSQRLLSDAGVALIRIGPSGHWPFIDQTDRFVEELLKILDKNSE